MARFRINNSHLDMAWGFYLKDPSIAGVHRACVAAGLPVHKNTVRNWVVNGLKSKGVESFRDRLGRIREAAQAIAAKRAAEERADKDMPSPEIQAEIVAARTMDTLVVKAGVANLEQWRGQMDLQLLHAAIANDKIMESLMGVDPANPKDMKDVMTAWKNAISAQRGIIESHSVLRGMADPDAKGPAGSDRDIMENFEGWTPEEHRLFRVEGVWPESRGPAPDFILETTAASSEDPEDDQGDGES